MLRSLSATNTLHAIYKSCAKIKQWMWWLCSGLQPTRVQQASPAGGSAVVEGSVGLGARDLPVPPQDPPSEPDTAGRHDGDSLIQNTLFKGRTWRLQVQNWFFRMSNPPRSKSSRSSFHSESFRHTWAGNSSFSPPQETSSLWPTTASANGTRAGAACPSSPGITPRSDREDETPRG